MFTTRLTSLASIAAGLNQIRPVSGNWCWISGKNTELRYALGHAWRFSIIIATIGIYVYIWIYMSRHYKMLNLVTTGESYNHQSSAQRREFRQGDAFELRSESQMELHQIHVEYQVAIKHSEEDPAESPTTDLEANDCHKSGTTVSVTSDNGPYSKETSGTSSCSCAWPENRSPAPVSVFILTSLSE